jgi:hypothetical protein
MNDWGLRVVKKGVPFGIASTYACFVVQKSTIRNVTATSKDSVHRFIICSLKFLVNIKSSWMPAHHSAYFMQKVRYMVRYATR